MVQVIMCEAFDTAHRVTWPDSYLPRPPQCFDISQGQVRSPCTKCWMYMYTGYLPTILFNFYGLVYVNSINGQYLRDDVLECLLWMILKRLIVFLIHHVSIDYLLSSLYVDNPWAMLIAITSLQLLLVWDSVNSWGHRHASFPLAENLFLYSTCYLI